MKNTKRMLVSLFCILVLCLGLILTSCGGCDHEWSEWETIKEATCGEKGKRTRTCSLCEETETEDIRATGHAGDGIVCENCLLPTFELPARDEALDFSSFGIKLTGLEMVVEDWEYPSTDSTITVDLAEFYVTLDENDKLLGYGTGKLNNKLTNVQGHSSDIDAVVAVKDNVVYISLVGKFPTSTQNFKNYMQFEVEQVGTFIQLQEKLEEYTAMAETYAPTLETWLEETLAPIFKDVKVEVDTAPATKLAAKFINALFDKTDDGYVFSLDALKAWNEALATKSVVEIFDDVLGEGSFAKVVEFLTDDKTYALSVADVIEYIEDEQGVDLAALLDALDALVAEITENEDATFESVIAPYIFGAENVPEDFDIGAYLENEELLALSLSDALAMLFGPDDPETDECEPVEAVKAMVGQYAEMLEETTVYEIVFGSMMGGQAAPAESESQLEAMIEDTVERINGMIDEVASYINLAIIVEDGKFVSIDIEETIENIEIFVSVSVTEDGLAMDYTISVPNTVDAEMSIEFIPGHTVAENADKIAAIKTEVAKAPVTKDVLKAILEKEYAYGNVKILDDTANSRFVVVTCSPYDYYADENYAKIKAYVFYYDDAYAVVVSPDCKDTVEVTISYNFYEATATVETTFDTVGEFIEAITVAHVNVPDEALDITDRNFDYYYNTKTGAVTFESAHDWDYEHEDYTSCDEIYKVTITCENCNESYYRWVNDGHWFELSYELKDETKGIKGGFYVVLTCQEDGCESNIEKVSISVDVGSLTVSEATADVSILGNGIFFAFTATEDATYEISSVITNGKELQRDVAVYVLDGTGFDDIVNVGYDKTEWSYDFEVEEGKTYIVKLSTSRYEAQPGAEATIKFTKKVAE